MYKFEQIQKKTKQNVIRWVMSRKSDITITRLLTKHIVSLYKCTMSTRPIHVYLYFYKELPY